MRPGDFVAIFRGTEKPDPTAARLCAKKPSFQFGTCDRQGSHGQCSRLGVSHGKSLSEKSPSLMPRRNASTLTTTPQHIKKTATRNLITVFNNQILSVFITVWVLLVPSPSRLDDFLNIIVLRCPSQNLTSLV